jgi:hypothetical protein
MAIPAAGNGFVVDWDSWGKPVTDQLNAMVPINASVKTSTTTVSNTVTETVLHTYTIGASVPKVGSWFKLWVSGTCDITGTPALTFRARLGGLTGTILGAVGITGAANTNRPWRAKVALCCLTTGAGGTWTSFFEEISMIAGSATPLIDNATGVPQNTTVSNDLVITVQWGTASASNTLRADIGIGLRVTDK